MHSPQNESKQRLAEEVHRYFTEAGLSSKGSLALHAKPFIFIPLLCVSYWGLVFSSQDWRSVVAWSAGMVFAMGGIGFGYAHDACHGAFSTQRWRNRLAGWGYDLIGGSSYVWTWKHNVLHHRHPNQSLADPDVQTRPFLRLSATQERWWFHRFQQYYFPLLYLFIGLRWQLWQDFATYFRGELVGKKFQRPRGLDFLVFWGGKLSFFCFAFVLPCWLHPWPRVLVVYLGIIACLGLVLGLILQVAHCTEGAAQDKAGPPGSSEVQIESTSNYCSENKFLTWYTGGLNFHIEHHLFPSTASVHYPALSTFVQAYCMRQQIIYRSYPTYRQTFAAHFRHLRELGRR